MDEKLLVGKVALALADMQRAHAELGALAPAKLLESISGFKVPAGHAAFADVSELPQYKANLASHARCAGHAQVCYGPCCSLL